MSKLTDEEKSIRKALNCLYLEVDYSIADDINKRFNAFAALQNKVSDDTLIELDCILASFEDWMHGEDGIKITKARNIISKLQTNERKDNAMPDIEKLIEKFLPNQFDLESFKPPEVELLKSAFQQGATVMFFELKNSDFSERKDNVGVSDAIDFAEYFRNNFDYYDCNANGSVYKWIDLKRGRSAMTMIQIFDYWKSYSQPQQKEV